MQSHLLLPLALIPAKLLGGVAKRMRIPAVVGEIAAGVMLGPALLGFLPSELSAVEGDGVFHVLAQIGLCVLLFKIGLETRLSDFIKVRRPATIIATGRFAFQRSESGYRQYRQDLGRAILLGLEFLVAGDIIRTVVVAPTLENVYVLGLIVLIRTFLSFSLQLEIEGRLPWQRVPSPNPNP